MTEHVDSATYRDIVEEVGARRLAELDAVVEGEPVASIKDVVGYTHDITRPANKYGPLEYTTTYRASVYPQIDGGILRHPTVPNYLQVIISALTGALVNHTNLHHLPRLDQSMQPDDEQLQTHLDTIWLSYSGSQPTKLRDEATLYRASGRYPVSLQLVRQGGHLALDYVHQQARAQIRF